jgi:hypothetical protein
MSKNKLTPKNTHGNATLVSSDHAAERSRGRAGLFLRRRLLIVAFVVFNIAVWALLIAITFR